MQTNQSKRILFLQGPHGPFFRRLAGFLEKAGAEVWRIGFNAGDKAFWYPRKNYIAFRDPASQWDAFFKHTLENLEITDIVLYGDTKPNHKAAIEIAREAGLTIHVFEEGYLRPYWITYERNGANGNSPLMDISIDEMQAALGKSEVELPEPPSHWGDMRHHIFYGAIYHWFILFMNWRYPNFRTHRELSVFNEAKLYTFRLLMMPYLAFSRRIATARIRFGGFPYHLVLLQLEHDSSFQVHSPFTRMEDFLVPVIENFAAHAPGHHHLVVKAHPLENGCTPVRTIIKKTCQRLGIKGRVHYVRGGKLARLLDHARTALAVNSTAGQQVIWRGIPMRVFGAAVYDKPEITSHQALSEFFKNPKRPDTTAFRDYRRYLLETCQIPGGFYSTKGRRRITRLVVDLMLSDKDPYEAQSSDKSPVRPYLKII